MVRDAPRKFRGLALQLDAAVFIVVLAIISGAILSYSGSVSDNAKITRAKAELATLGVACSQYAYEINQRPTFAKLGGTALKDGISYGPWIKDATPTDPWGRAYVLITTDSYYIVYSKGASGSGSFSSETNFTSTNQIGFSSSGAIGYYGRWGVHPLPS